MLPKYVDIMEWVAVNSTSAKINFLLRINSIDLYSFRLLYKLERVLWCYHGVLYSASMSYYVCWPDVRLSFDIGDVMLLT
jgi:hypothetical protein